MIDVRPQLRRRVALRMLALACFCGTLFGLSHAGACKRAGQILTKREHTAAAAARCRPHVCILHLSMRGWLVCYPGFLTRLRACRRASAWTARKMRMPTRRPLQSCAPPTRWPPTLPQRRLTPWRPRTQLDWTQCTAMTFWAARAASRCRRRCRHTRGSAVACSLCRTGARTRPTPVIKHGECQKRSNTTACSRYQFCAHACASQVLSEVRA